MKRITLVVVMEDREDVDPIDLANDVQDTLEGDGYAIHSVSAVPDNPVPAQPAPAPLTPPAFTLRGTTTSP